ncbi:unnamed protein product [Angiostrongylus costaricensis]|uniref:Uncharacterized protein n=1 Tax=Angiostrongylus costaricensis TaxID=334426 RepID=A0A0R3PW91_ANGCS|nr:unnamed protein product [Angiostrongylus costaricensis]
METEVIILDSDDEDLPNSAPQANGSALASIAIVNSKPLDLGALGIGSLNVEDGVLSNNQSQRYYATRPAETRSQDVMSLIIKPNISTPNAQTGTVPQDSQRPNVRSSSERVRSEPQFREEYGIDAASLLGSTPITHRSEHSRLFPGQMQLQQLPESRVHNYNFEVSGEKSSESDRQLCPSLKFKLSVAFSFL